MRSATRNGQPVARLRSISIHAPRAERDQVDVEPGAEHADFNPRAPCGARLIQLRYWFSASTFQSTRPVRSATLAAIVADLDAEISIHAPRAERDPCHRLPPLPAVISIHAPRAERDKLACVAFCCALNFNPRAPCGARPSRSWWKPSPRYFNPRAPCGARQTGRYLTSGGIRFQSTRPVRSATVFQ